MSDIETVGVLGFGEAGRAVAEAFDDGETSVSVINRSPADLREMLAETSLSVPDSPADLAARSDLIVSCVWPAFALEAATDAAPGLSADTAFLDLNSITPTATLELRRLVEDADGTFLKGAIMGSIARRDGDVRIRTAGVGSEPAVDSLRSAGFTVEPLGDDITRPAALKMLRSLMTKNLRTLAAETLLAARAYDLEAEALASIGSKFDGTTFDEWLVDALDGTPAHAERRIGELEAIQETVERVGFHSPTTETTIDLHRRVHESTIDFDGYEDVLRVVEPVFDGTTGED